MMNGKIDSSTNGKLYGSAIYEDRNKVSSMYQKRPAFNVPDLHTGGNYLTPNYLEPARKYSQHQEIPKLALSFVGEGETHKPSTKYDTPARSKLTFNIPESKSSSKYQPATDRVVYNQNANIPLLPNKKKVQLSSKMGAMNLSDSNEGVERLLEKLNKKEKIIQELQKLSNTKVSDKLRNPPVERGIYETYSPSLPKKRAYEQQLGSAVNYEETKNSGERVSTPSTFKIDLVQSQAVKVSNQPTLTVNPPKERSKYERNEPVPRKNPEELYSAKDIYRKINASYNTPKQSKASNDFEDRKDKPKGQTRKSYNFQKYTTNEASLRPPELAIPSRKTITDASYISQAYSPVKTRKSKDFQPVTMNSNISANMNGSANVKQQKPAKDIRQMFQTKNIKSGNGYFAGRKVSLYEFDLQKTLGQGKFGIVYQAFHRQTNSLFALKKISKKIIKQNLMVDQLQQQIKIQSYCNNENILKIYGFFDDAEHIYLILEYMEEGTLFSLLKTQKTFNEEETKHKLKDIVKAIVYLHKEGIAHRDIKPENIVMSNGVGKLCDFGWAAICTDRRKTYCGTFDYVAPQILEGSQYDASVDLWCLGVLAYQLLVGKAPFYHISRKQTMKKIMKVQKLQFPSHISKTAISFIENLIKKNPEERMNGQNILNHPFLAETDHV